MPRADMMTAHSPAEESVLTFFRALMVKDFETWGNLFTADARQENPFMPEKEGLAPGFVGRDRIVFHYSTVLKNRKNHVFDVRAIHQTTDPDCVIVEVGGRSDVPETGRVYNQEYVIVFTFRDGKISNLREYFNPLAFEAAFDGFLVGENAIES